MRKFKVIFSIESEIFEEIVEAENFTCPDNSIKFYVDQRMVALFKNMRGITQIDGQKERTESEKAEDEQWKKSKKKKDDEEDSFSSFK